MLILFLFQFHEMFFPIYFLQYGAISALQCENYRNLPSHFLEKFRETNVFTKVDKYKKLISRNIFFRES